MKNALNKFGIKDRSFFSSVRPSMSHKSNTTSLCSFYGDQKYFKKFETKAKFSKAFTLKNLSDGYEIVNPSRSISKGTKPITH